MKAYFHRNMSGGRHKLNLDFAGLKLSLLYVSFLRRLLERFYASVGCVQ